MIPAELIAAHNAGCAAALDDDLGALERKLERRGINLERVLHDLSRLELALPSWGVGRGGTRFARFPIPGEPTNIHEKLEDCAIIQQLGRNTPRVSLHLPWDESDDYSAMRETAAGLGLGFDAINSNTFQDQPGQAHSYQAGSLAATDSAVRAQAVAHNLECIAIGRALGSQAITVWVGDGSNLPGQQHLARAYDRYLDSASAIHAGLPYDWRMLLEHKFFEPAFYSTVIADWGSSILAAQTIGEKAFCLVDLGHHAQGVNIEQIVARLHRFGKLGGFHFNDSKYGDDDLDSGAINPHQLFLVFNELVEVGAQGDFRPAYMIDQSHNVTDPIESLLSSAEAIAIAQSKALIVDRAALHEAQDKDDAMLAFRILREAYETDVTALVAKLRVAKGGAADPITAYRTSHWRSKVAQSRKPSGPSSGIV